MSLDLANGPRLEGICLLNIPSAHAGTNLWGENQQSRKKHKFRETEYTVGGVTAGGDLHCAVQGETIMDGYLLSFATDLSLLIEIITIVMDMVDV